MTIQPEHAVFFSETVILPWLIQEHRLTKRVIEAIPVAQGDYRPHPAARSALELAWHIVSAELRYLNGVADGAFDLSTSPMPEQLAPWYSDGFTKAIAKLQGMPPDRLLKVLDYRGVLVFPAVFFLQIALTHTVHHRGQLSTYLRPMGAKVPAIYGESADSQSRKE